MYAQYTRVFGTCKEPQKSIKFSPFYRGRGPQKILLYFWGEGANEQKTNKRIKISLFGQKQDLRRVRAFARTRQETSRGPHKILVLMGQNGIKILPFWKRYYLIKFSPFWREFFMSLRSTALRGCGNLPEGNPCHKTHARYFCTCVEKKAHTSKRVSIIACNNVISKVQSATHRPEGQQYKTKQFYIKSVLFRFAFRNGYA